MHKTLNSSRGVIRCRELSVLSEVEIRDELKSQGVVEVHRVMVKKEGKVIPTNPCFLPSIDLTCQRSSKLDVLIVTSLATQTSVAKQQQNVNGMERINMKSSVMNPRYALIAMVLTLLLPKNARSGRRRREIQRIRVEKRISFPEARQLVEATFPSTGFTSNLSFADVLNKKKLVKPVVCQTDLIWVSSDTPVQTVHSVALVSGGPGSVSTGTQASSGKSGPASADARSLRESALKADKSSGSPDAGPSASPEHLTLTRGAGSRSSSEPRLPTDGARSRTSAPRRMPSLER